MPRSIRIEFAGAIYHVMVRGNRRENIFMDDEYRRTFLRSLAEVKPLHQRVQNMVQTVTNVSLPPFLLYICFSLFRHTRRNMLNKIVNSPYNTT